MSSELFKTHGFEEIASCQVAGVFVSKYKSSRTGLLVCLAHVESPLVNGYFCLGARVITGGEGNIRGSEYSYMAERKSVENNIPSFITTDHILLGLSVLTTISYFIIVATEAHDHDGLPHTLEHLIFMGSEEYPYKVMHS